MRRTSLARRLPLVMAAVAGIAVLIAALVAWPLLSSAADTSARRSLARTADLTADLLQGTNVGDSPLPAGVTRQLSALFAPQQVSAYLVATQSLASPSDAPMTNADIGAVTSGQGVSAKRSVGDDEYYIEGRPIRDGLGVLLIQPAEVAQDLSQPALTRLLLALLLGLSVAALIGYLLARRITRPLGEAAAAANAMSSGQRDIRIDPDGPAEVADLAEALNGLAAALTESEDRQREFFLTVSHELRTPLTSIKGYAEALSDGVVPEQDVPQVATVVRSEADHLDRLVADLLDLARLGAVDVQVEPIDLDLAVLGAEVAAVWSARAGRSGVRFVDQVDRRPFQVRTDPVRVRQIVDNLMENALRVTDEGAPVVLTIGPAPQPGWFQLEVRDGGPGLTTDDLSVAFEPGELHARYRGIRKVGSGVGLALVARLAQRLGGRAEAGMAAEGGAAFRVMLPTAVAGADSVAGEPSPGPR